MKRQLAALACAMSMSALLPVSHAQAAPSNERTLPALVVKDAQGAPVDLSALHPNENWILVVLDASLPSSDDFLAALDAKGVELDARVQILVLGSAADSARLQPARERIKGATWLRQEHAQAVRDLQLPGTPCMLGLHGAHKIAWQFSGVPNPREQAYFMARDWLQAADATPNQ